MQLGWSPVQGILQGKVAIQRSRGKIVFALGTGENIKTVDDQQITERISWGSQHQPIPTLLGFQPVGVSSESQGQAG